MSKTIDYRVTNGLFVYVPQINKRLLAKIAFEFKEDKSVICYVENANSLCKIRKCGSKTISIDDFNNLGSDMDFNRNAFSLFCINIQS